jgi:hypothetical protein
MARRQSDERPGTADSRAASPELRALSSEPMGFGHGEPAREDDEALARVAPDVTNDEIAIRAYELYEARGGDHGRDWDDWLEAERELMKRRGGPGPTPS